MPRDGSPRLFLETALLGCFYCVENRSDFVQVFAVELVRHQHDPQFLLLVPVDPKQKGHERPILRGNSPSLFAAPSKRYRVIERFTIQRGRD